MAGDFYRIRLMRLDEGETPDLEWRDDILFRTPPPQPREESHRWVVQAVDIDDEESFTPLAEFGEQSDAQEFESSAEKALTELTRAEFEERLFPAE